MSARFRVDGEIIRSDTTKLDIMKEFHSFSDLTEYVDTKIAIAAAATQAVDMTTIGTAKVVYLFPSTTVAISINGGTAFNVSNFLLLDTSSVTAISLTNNGSVSLTVRLIMGS